MLHRIFERHICQDTSSIDIRHASSLCGTVIIFGWRFTCGPDSRALETPAKSRLATKIEQCSQTIVMGLPHRQFTF
jgi:hypothetical protein